MSKWPLCSAHLRSSVPRASAHRGFRQRRGQQWAGRLWCWGAPQQAACTCWWPAAGPPPPPATHRDTCLSLGLLQATQTSCFRSQLEVLDTLDFKSMLQVSIYEKEAFSICTALLSAVSSLLTVLTLEPYPTFAERSMPSLLADFTVCSGFLHKDTGHLDKASWRRVHVDSLEGLSTSSTDPCRRGNSSLILCFS